MSASKPPRWPRLRTERAYRVVTFMRSDLSGGNSGRHHRAIEKLCAEKEFVVVESVSGDAVRYPNPSDQILSAVTHGRADAVIVPSADHLGTGLNAVSAVALVMVVDPPGEVWAHGMRLTFP